MKRLTINRLISGGVITNYYCSSKCRHCLYACSPKWDKKYMKEDMAGKVLETILSMGCRSVHIGGGEPFLDIASLKKVLSKVKEKGIGVEYIETNSSWYRDEKTCAEILEEVKEYGISTLLISISPFHNEYIPFYKVKGVIGACQKAGVSVFPWIQDFYSEIDSLNDSRPHSLDEYCQRFGEDYIKNVPSRYWISFGGRAIQTYKDIFKRRDVEEVIEYSRKCDELASTSHFHIDLFGNYIPGLCSGISIDIKDLGSPLDVNRYPLISILYNEGIKGLLRFARERHGFIPQRQYMSKCHLCLEIRTFLVNNTGDKYKELQPGQFYSNI